jgi:hypothetical protein
MHTLSMDHAAVHYASYQTSSVFSHLNKITHYFSRQHSSIDLQPDEAPIFIQWHTASFVP